MNPPAFQPAPPADLDLEEQVTTDPDSPAVAGQQPVKIKLQANGETCRELVVIKDTLTGAVSAMKELYQALARLQYPAVGSPGYTENSCELSEYIYAPNVPSCTVCPCGMSWAANSACWWISRMLSKCRMIPLQCRTISNA